MHRSPCRIVIAMIVAVALAAPAAHAAPRSATSIFEREVRGVWQDLAGWFSDLATWQSPLSSPEGCAKEGPGLDAAGLEDLPPGPPWCGAAACTDAGPGWDPEG